MSAGIQNGWLEESPEETGDISQEDILAEISLPTSWVIKEESERGSLFLVKAEGQKRRKSISLSISHRKHGDKIRGRYRKAPYRRDRVGSDPVERETFDTWSEAINWVQDRL